MFDYTNFDDVFLFNKSFSYPSDAVDAIEQHRIAFEGLFVDKVLKSLDVKRPSKSYPPKDNHSLRSLHQAVVTSPAAEINKLSLLFYLLLDCDEYTTKHAYSDAFEAATSLPPRYAIFMKGIWHMDRSNFPKALEYLTHPSLIPTWQDEILEKLVNNTDGDTRLALAYYHTVQPTLTDPKSLDLIFGAIVKTSITEAYFFLKSQAPGDQERLFDKLLHLVLHEPLGEKAAAHGLELINLPFSKEEERLFEHYMTEGDGKRVPRARDFVMMRRVGTGKFGEALGMDCARSRAVGGVNWETLQEGIRQGLGPRYDISRMR